MVVTTLSSRGFNQDTGRAKGAAESGPVFITDRGVPRHVLLSIADYQRLLGGQANIIDQLSLPEGVGDIPLDTPLARDLPRPVDLGGNITRTQEIGPLF